MEIKSKYLLDYEACLKEWPDGVGAPWEAQYKALLEDKDSNIYNFVMQFIFQ